ncbi:MAG: hypothetical protein BWY83_00176 [bacterium ADurb.Bin478]|nr:MAG: hypothetical protein BWY83_00176 [bacterium ADurb.Bin478]
MCVTKRGVGAEIRRPIHLVEKGCQRRQIRIGFAGRQRRPDQASLAQPALSGTRFRAPQLVDQLLHLLIAFRIIGQRRGGFRWMAKDHGAVVNQRANFLQQLRRHRRALGQDQQSIRCAAIQLKTAFFNLSMVQQNLRCTAVKVIARAVRQAAVLRQRHRPKHIGRTLGSQQTDIRHSDALLQKILTARQVGVKSADERPPGLRTFPVDAIGPHGHAGHAVQPGLMGIAMKRQPVDAGAKRPVGLRFHDSGVQFPSFVMIRCERLGCDDGTTLSVGDGGCFKTAIVGIEPIPPGPEFAHGHIRDCAEAQVCGWVHVIGLDGEPETVFMRQLFEITGVIFQ